MRIKRGSAPRCYEVCIISSMLFNTSSQSKVSNSAYFITLSSLCNYKTIKGHENLWIRFYLFLTILPSTSRHPNILFQWSCIPFNSLHVFILFYVIICYICGCHVANWGQSLICSSLPGFMYLFYFSDFQHFGSWLMPPPLKLS